ncbi:3-hydroxyisobutyrate dehydrogenase [Vibrio sagamiensis]|uniref:3-hydroxyisobutyrate dehydrogenase n=1 Tax=Vibrio sagamiensis NBRC 104589 TaxID=1219064 RepID=A0A511QCR9_9VIBR|nr:3-hydroxyisobutyrate dehydrogenase [Vibrio sagamiensis]PNQ54159.1 3-hydroxyisobutyrate dehydrogenase [Vibrio agarivorans]GEM75094.1 3-hydroxyisobutyrate dehydrogenase [Vibrio sagamiensis NBRC 104589]
MSTVAFIGLGNMGSPMAQNLLASGLKVNVFDLNRDAAKQLERFGAIAAETIDMAIEGAGTVITMLPAGEHVRSVYFGAGEGNLGLLDKVPEKTVLIDCSTIDPDTARKVAQKAESKQLLFVDAPVSGGVAGAKAGTLTFIVGGNNEAFSKANAILQYMGKNVFHAGKAGDGQMAKICNNLMLGILMSGTCEALNLGIDHGLDPKVLANIMLQSSGRNWALELYNPCPGIMENAPASHHYQPGFMSKLMLKDLGLGMEAAMQTQSSVPMGALARNLYALHNSNGHGELDFSSLFEFYKHQNG